MSGAAPTRSSGLDSRPQARPRRRGQPLQQEPPYDILEDSHRSESVDMNRVFATWSQTASIIRYVVIVGFMCVALAALRVAHLRKRNKYSASGVFNIHNSNNTKQDDAIFRIYTDRRDISPKTLLWQAGFSSRNHTAESTQSKYGIPLYATIAIIQGSPENTLELNPSVVLQKEFAILISLDLIGAHRRFTNHIFREVEQRFGLSREQIVLCFSHTHSGPIVGENLRVLHHHARESAADDIRAYEVHLTDTILGLIESSLAAFPSQSNRVSLHHGSAEYTNVLNRRAVKESALTGLDADRLTTEMRKGFRDPQIHILAFISESDDNEESAKIKPVLTLFVFAAHATVLTQNYQYSGDYPSYTVREIETRLGGTAMYLAGCGGDQNLYPRGSDTWLKHHGLQIATQIVSAIESWKSFRSVSSPFLGKASATVHLEFEQVWTKAQLKQKSKDPKAPWYEQKGSEFLLQRLQGSAEAQTESSYPFPVVAWLFGNSDLGVVFLGGEMVVEYALRLETANITAENVIPVAYANDVMGYVPSEAVLKERGYESGERSHWLYELPSRFAPGLQVKIISTVMNLFASLETTKSQKRMNT